MPSLFILPLMLVAASLALLLQSKRVYPVLAVAAGGVSVIWGTVWAVANTGNIQQADLLATYIVAGLGVALIFLLFSGFFGYYTVLGIRRGRSDMKIHGLMCVGAGLAICGVSVVSVLYAVFLGFIIGIPQLNL